MIRTRELQTKAGCYPTCELEAKLLGNGNWQFKHRCGSTHTKAFDPTVDLSPNGWMTPVYEWIEGHHV